MDLHIYSNKLIAKRNGRVDASNAETRIPLGMNGGKTAIFLNELADFLKRAWFVVIALVSVWLFFPMIVSLIFTALLLFCGAAFYFSDRLRGNEKLHWLGTALMVAFWILGIAIFYFITNVIFNWNSLFCGGLPIGNCM